MIEGTDKIQQKHLKTNWILDKFRQAME